MENLKRLCLMWVVVLPLFSAGQRKISGAVKDSIGNGISNALVSLIYKKTGAGIIFTRSDERGQYILTLVDSFKNAELAVRVNAIGYLKAVESISSGNSTLNFILHSEPNELPGVTVKNTGPRIRLTGDTLNYQVSDFADRNDRVIGDVIRKIPGIEIDENGTIKYQGKAINYFYIDGDNILDEKYTIATKNIPNDIVEKIQIIENNQHIKMLNGIVISDRAALNITLKENAKMNFINTAKAGVGISNELEGELNSMAFKTKFKAVNILKYGNTGSDLIEEVSSHKSNSPGNNGEIGTTGNLLNIGIAGTPGIQKSRYLFNNGALVGINDFFKSRRDISLRVNAYYLHDRQSQSYNYYANYYLPTDTIYYNERQDIDRNLHDLHAVFTANVNTKKRYINNSLTFDYQVNADEANLGTNSRNVAQQLYGTVQGISNNFNAIKLFKNGKFIEFFSVTGYEGRPQQLHVSPGLHAEVLNKNMPFNESIQHTNTPVFFTHNFISYKIGNGVFFQNYKAGFSYQGVDFRSSLLIRQLNSLVSLSDSFSNQFDWHKSKIYLEADYRWETAKSSVNILLPAGYWYINYHDTLFQKKEAIRRLLVQPSVKWRYKLGNENSFNVGYQYNTQLSSFNDVYSGIIMNNYQSFTSNDVPIQETYYHSYNASFDFRRSIKLFFMNFSVSYAERLSNFLFALTLQNNITQKEVRTLPNTRYSSTISYGISKYIFRFKTNLTGRYAYQYGRLQQIQNGVLFPLVFFSNSMSVGLNSKPTRLVSINIESLHVWSSTHAGTRPGSQFSRQQSYFSKHQLEVSLFLFAQASFKWRNDYYYNRNFNQDGFSFLFSDLSFRYNLPGTSTDFELICSNLTNRDYFSVNSVSENSLTGSDYLLRPRMLYIRASFRL